MNTALRWLIIVSGVRVPDLSGRLAYPKIFRAYCALTDAILLVHFASFGVGALDGGSGVAERCFRIYVAIFCLNGPLVFLCLEQRSAELERVSASLAATRPEPRFRTTVTLLKFAAAVEVTGVLVWFSQQIIDVARNIRDDSLLGYHPFDNLASPNLELAILAQSLAAIYISTKMTCFYGLLLELCSRMIVRYTSLRKNLRLAVNSCENETALREWIKRHQETNKLGQSLQEIFSFALLFHYSIQLFVTCTMVFVIVKGEQNNTEKTVSGTFVLAHLMKLFLICRIGDYISNESNRISEDCGDWFACPKKEKNTLKVILTRTKVNIKLSAIGVFPLNSETFRSVVATAYSYYKFLDELKNH